MAQRAAGAEPGFLPQRPVACLCSFWPPGPCLSAAPWSGQVLRGCVPSESLGQDADSQNVTEHLWPGSHAHSGPPLITPTPTMAGPSPGLGVRVGPRFPDVTLDCQGSRSTGCWSEGRCDPSPAPGVLLSLSPASSLWPRTDRVTSGSCCPTRALLVFPAPCRTWEDPQSSSRHPHLEEDCY